MACSVIKKGLLGAALGAGALYLAFGTSAPSYVRTAFHQVRDNAKSSAPVQFEIDRAREEIAGLEPAIKDYIENLARAKVEVEHLDREIVAIRTNLGTEKKVLTALREQPEHRRLPAGRQRHYTADEVKGELKHRRDHYSRSATCSRTRKRPSRPSRRPWSPPGSSSPRWPPPSRRC